MPRGSVWMAMTQAWWTGVGEHRVEHHQLGTKNLCGRRTQQASELDHETCRGRSLGFVSQGLGFRVPFPETLLRVAIPPFVEEVPTCLGFSPKKNVGTCLTAKDYVHLLIEGSIEYSAIQSV